MAGGAKCRQKATPIVRHCNLKRGRCAPPFFIHLKNQEQTEKSLSIKMLRLNLHVNNIIRYFLLVLVLIRLIS